MYNVLLVDDEYMILEGLKHLLDWKELGFQVVATARLASEAFKVFENEKIDLIISDITMPEMSGIDMISHMRQKNEDFEVVFLSGYQEFEYVKESIRLQAKNYLVKPVDEEELKATIMNIKHDLDEKNYQKEQRQLYLENNLNRWLNDELNEQEFYDLMKEEQLDTKGPFTVVTIVPRQISVGALERKIIQSGQKLLIHHQPEELSVIVKGDTEVLNDFLLNLNRSFPDGYQSFVGETMDSWESVYESYEKVRQLEALHEFYPDLLSENQKKENILQEETTLSFWAFNKSLMIGDLHTIQGELRKVFQEAIDHQVRPENARYIGFLLMTDILRQYPNFSTEVYEETIEKIRHSQTIVELEDLLENVLHHVGEQPKQVQFSEMVQKAVDRIILDYREDLTLKGVADELHLNAVYLGQLFKKEVHSSFSQYLNQVRIKKAQQLLLYSNLNINEIAEEIGYNNTNYFSKMFKKLNGLCLKN